MTSVSLLGYILVFGILFNGILSSVLDQGFSHLERLETAERQRIRRSPGLVPDAPGLSVVDDALPEPVANAKNEHVEPVVDAAKNLPGNATQKVENVTNIASSKLPANATKVLPDTAKQVAGRATGALKGNGTQGAVTGVTDTVGAAGGETAKAVTSKLPANATQGLSEAGGVAKEATGKATGAARTVTEKLPASVPGASPATNTTQRTPRTTATGEQARANRTTRAANEKNPTNGTGNTSDGSGTRTLDTDHTETGKKKDGSLTSNLPAPVDGLTKGLPGDTKGVKSTLAGTPVGAVADVIPDNPTTNLPVVGGVGNVTNTGLV